MRRRGRDRDDGPDNEPDDGPDDGPAYEEVPVAPEGPMQTGYLDAEPVPPPDDEATTGETEASKYPVAHVIDRELDEFTSMCGEEIEGELLEDRVLAYTCTACQVAMTEQKNALVDELLASQLRLRVIQSAVLGFRGRGLDTGWTRRVREVAADATDALLSQADSGALP